MKSVSAASVLLGSALALIACAPDARDGSGDGGGGGSGSGSGSGGGSGVAQAWNQMDLVFVVDDSGSMQEEQANLGDNFPMFADVLLNYVNADGEHIDFRVAVTTTGKDIAYSVSLGGTSLPMSESGDNGEFRDTCGVSRRWLEPTDPNLGSALACRAGVGTGGPSYEMPLLMSKWALSERVADGTNAGFLRTDALLGIVILTDEDDASSTQNNFVISATDPNAGPQIDWNPADHVAFLDQLKGNRTRWAAGVIAGETDCMSSFGSAAEATRLQQFVDLTNAQGPQQAVFTSICNGNLTTALTDIVNKFQSACGSIIL